jgi:hypothetical protein
LFICIYILCTFNWNKKRKSTARMRGVESFKTIFSSAFTGALWFGQLCAEKALASLVGLSSYVSIQTNVMIALLGRTFACVSVRKHIVFLSRETEIIYLTMQTVTVGRLRLKCGGARAETVFRISAKQTSPIKSAGEPVQSTAGSRAVRISGSNAGYTVFRGSVKSTGYPLHSPVSPSLSLPCVTVCRHISAGL